MSTFKEVKLILVLLVCLQFVMITGFDFRFPRKGNCSHCNDNISMKISNLPRLALIKKIIQEAVNRTAGNNKTTSTLPPGSKNDHTTTPSPAKTTTEGFRKDEIVSFSEMSVPHQGGTVLKFRIHKNVENGTEEAIGVTLYLRIDRRRRTRKGGKGKKIFLELSSYESNNDTWSSLTVLRTRVKKRCWKRIRLPVYVAQQLLDSDKRSLDLKVKCQGCGRLVQLVLYNNESERRMRRGNRKRIHKRKTPHKTRPRRPYSGNNSPILVIDTKYKIGLAK